MEKQFNRNRKNLIVSYNNVDNKIILGFVNEVAADGKSYDYYVLDIKEAAVFIDHVIAIKELFEEVILDPSKSIEENYVRPKRIKLPASEEELYYDYLKELAQVCISIPGSDNDVEHQINFTNNCIEFMEALGYESDMNVDLIEHSEFLLLNFKRANKAPESEVKELYVQGVQALENKLQPKPAKAISKIADAAANLISAFANSDEVSLRLGSILIVKAMRDEKAIIKPLLMSSPLIRMLDEYPQLLKHPIAVLEIICPPEKKKEVKSWRKP